MAHAFGWTQNTQGDSTQHTAMTNAATVDAHALAIDAIRAMDQAPGGYVWVLEQEQISGVLTASDVVRAIATGVTFDHMTVAELLTTLAARGSRAIATDGNPHPIALKPHSPGDSCAKPFERPQSSDGYPASDSLMMLQQTIADLHNALHQAIAQLTAQEVTMQQPLSSLHGPEETYRQTVEESPNPIFWVDQAGIIQTWNSACKQLYQYDHTICGQPFTLLWPNAETRAAVDIHFKAVLAGQTVNNIELIYRCKDGSLRHTLSRLYPWRNEQKAIVGCVFANTDITERKQAEMVLQQSRDALAEAQRLAHLGNWSWELSRRAIVWSDEASYIFGLEPQAAPLKYRTLWALIHPDDRGSLRQQMMQTLRQNVPCELEVRIWRRDGSMRYTLVRATVARPLQGAPTHLFGTVQDITERKQTEILLRKQTHREQLLAQIAQRIRQSLDLHTILTTTVAEVRQFLQSDRVLIYQFEADGSGFIAVESTRSLEFSLDGHTIHDSCFQSDWLDAYRQGRMRVINDIYVEPLDPCHRDFLAQFQVWANLVVPILVGDRLWGLLIAHECTAPRHWQSWERDVLQQLATQVGIALQQAGLYEEVQRLNAHLEDQVQERTAQLQQAIAFDMLLKSITDKVRDSLDEDLILQKVVQELGLELGVFSCDTGLYDLEKQTSTVSHEYIAENMTPVRHKSLSMEDYRAIYDHLLQGWSLQLCWLPNMTFEGNFRSIDTHLTTLACPLIDDQGVLGDLWLYRSGHQPFSDMEIRLVEQVANQCAIAIRQARLYQAAQAQVQELERLNRLKDDFLCSVSHELRTPMANVKMATQMLEISLQDSGLLDHPDLPLNHYFQILKDECQRELNLINDLLDLSRLNSGTEPIILSTMDLRDWLAYMAEPFAERTRRHQQQLILDLPADLPALTTDFSYLARIIGELLTNACKYTPPHEKVILSATAHPLMVAIHVQNTGVHIPEAEQTRIFDRFYRILSHDPWRHEGTGLGLALVKTLVGLLQGTISVSSTETSVSFTVHLLRQPPNHDGHQGSLG